MTDAAIAARRARAGRPDRPATQRDQPATNCRGQRLSATARTFAILEHVAHAQRPVEVADIIAALDLPKATAYRLVDWFLDRGYLSREAGRKRLVVGARFADLSFRALASSMHTAAPHLVLRRLVNTVNETCNIGTLVSGEVVYLDRVEAEHWPLRLQFNVGSRVPLHCTAIGKLLLALAPARRRLALLHSVELRRFTEHTTTSRSRLEAELKQIRREQVSFDRQEFLLGVMCAAVPITGKNGEPLAAVAVQAPIARMTVETARCHLPALHRAAAELAEIFQDE
jgi:IclR family transcriptional regulator, acetate operon repressor